MPMLHIYWVLDPDAPDLAAVIGPGEYLHPGAGLRGFYNSERHWGVEVDGLSSYFVVAAWVAIYLTVFISPYLIR